MTNEKKILIVDDDEDVRDFYRLVLEAHGFKVVGVGTSAEGRRAAAIEKPDAIILDIMMEEAESGLDAARFFAQEHPSIPVALVSSILDAGAQIFDISSVPAALRLNKPLTQELLLDSVNSMTGRR